VSLVEDLFIAGAIEALVGARSVGQHQAVLDFLNAVPRPWLIALPLAQAYRARFNIAQAELSRRGPCSCSACTARRADPRAWN
jgi:hypothetical protein